MLAVSAACLVMAAPADTIHVWTDSASDGPGSTWSNAYRTIQGAVDVATNAGDVVLVTNGAYDDGEYIADTDPNDPNDYLRITAISNNSPVTVHFESSSNRWYTLIGSSNLLDNGWTDVSEAGARKGVHGPDSMADTNGGSHRHYRVKVGLTGPD